MSTKPPKAPRPGVGKRIQEANAASMICEITLKGETRRLAVGAVSMADRALLDKKLGFSYEECAMALDSGTVKMHLIFGLWFLAGRQADPSLSFEADDAAFTAMLPTLTADDINAELIEPEGDSPEA
jgi:hypothetical protein